MPFTPEFDWTNEGLAQRTARLRSADEARKLIAQTDLGETAAIDAAQAEVFRAVNEGGGLGGSGTTGATGVAGATGVGTTGATGVGGTGATGVVGATGPGGGATGPVGATGVAGPTGVIGVSGATGVVGVSGATGVVGVSGATGVNGVVGVSGATGVIGVSGATGAAGTTGATGVSGIRWLDAWNSGTAYLVDDVVSYSNKVWLSIQNGTNHAPAEDTFWTELPGLVGVTGATGVAGPTGVSGATGVVGVTGATGVVGVSGATGVVGVSGATGVGLIPNVQASDVTVTGITKTGTAGENLVFGDVCYAKSDGKWWKADANGSSTFPAQAMATGTIAADASGTFLMLGQARQDSWNWTIGGVLYLSTTAGAMTQTKPAATDDVIQVLGIALPNADTVWFRPSVDMMTHT